MKKMVRKAAVLALTLPLAVGLSATAQAKTNGQIKSSGNYASITWGSVEPGDGQTTYINGFLDVRGTKALEVNGSVETATCPEGADPWMDEAGECTYSGGYLTADPGAVKLTMDKKLTRATLTGTLNIYSFEDDSVVSESVNIALTGFGTTSTQKESYSYTDDAGVSFTYRATDTGRQASVSGSLAGHDLSTANGSLGTYKNAEKIRIP